VPSSVSQNSPIFGQNRACGFLDLRICGRTARRSTEAGAACRGGVGQQLDLRRTVLPPSFGLKPRPPFQRSLGGGRALVSLRCLVFPAKQQDRSSLRSWRRPIGEAATIRDPELHAGGKPPARSLLGEQLAGNRALIGGSCRQQDEGRITIPTRSLRPRTDISPPVATFVTHLATIKDRERPRFRTIGEDRQQLGTHSVPCLAMSHVIAARSQGQRPRRCAI
jgi:hypothetical protein